MSAQVETVERHPVPCSLKLKAGLMLGFTIGCGIGGIFAAGKAVKCGAKGKEFAKIVTKGACISGLSVGVFIDIITLLKC